MLYVRQNNESNFLCKEQSRRQNYMYLLGAWNHVENANARSTTTSKETFIACGTILALMPKAKSDRDK